jgi:hypothetical protein
VTASARATRELLGSKDVTRSRDLRANQLAHGIDVEVEDDIAGSLAGVVLLELDPARSEEGLDAIERLVGCRRIGLGADALERLRRHRVQGFRRHVNEVVQIQDQLGEIALRLTRHAQDERELASDCAEGIHAALSETSDPR